MGGPIIYSQSKFPIIAPLAAPKFWSPHVLTACHPVIHVGTSQNFGPLLVIGYITAPNIQEYQKRDLNFGSYSCSSKG